MASSSRFSKRDSPQNVQGSMLIRSLMQGMLKPRRLPSGVVLMTKLSESSCLCLGGTCFGKLAAVVVAVVNSTAISVSGRLLPQALALL